MVKNKIMIFATLLLLISLFIGFLLHRQLNPATNLALPTTTLKIKNINYQIEVAQTPGQLSAGLSRRSHLCPQCGMIFVFPHSGSLPFWMKDTLIPLDMIWLDSEGKVVDIQTATPQPDASLTQLKIYQNSKPAQYVIELNAKDSEKLGLKVGDIINLPPL